MAKVIGEAPQVARTVNCNGCGAIVEYYKNDVTEHKSYDYTGDYDMVYKLKCPRCGNPISVKAWY